MGFFYKSGAAEGVTVVEGASYDALASSAKTQAHGVLMLDTSTGFYYKNWKTNGPGIPIPDEIFEDITGYIPNASDSSKKAYFYGPDDFVAGGSPASSMYTRGWTALTTGTGSAVSKTASNPLILTGVTSGSGTSGCLFNTGSASVTHQVMIAKISEITDKGTPSNTKTGFRIIQNISSGGSGNQIYAYIDLQRAIGEAYLTNNDDTDATIIYPTSDQPDTSGVIDQWIIIECESENTQSPTRVRWLTDRQFAVARQSDLLKYTSPSTGAQICPLVSITSGTLINSFVKISEMHMFYI